MTFRLVPARSWVEMVAAFGDFEAAARFVADLAEEASAVRVAAAQEPMLTPAFTALADDVAADEALVMVIVADEEAGAVGDLAAARGGRIIPCRVWAPTAGPTLGYMVYGHRMLWVKKLFAQPRSCTAIWARTGGGATAGDQGALRRTLPGGAEVHPVPLAARALGTVGRRRDSSRRWWGW